MRHEPPTVAYRIGFAVRRAAIAISFGTLLAIVTRRAWLGFLIAFLILMVEGNWSAWLEKAQNDELNKRKESK